jgi:nucleotide-binding universal stress UspA family protein
LHKILVGSDGSDPSLKAVDFATRLAAETQADLIILTVTEPISFSDEALSASAHAEHLSTTWGDLSEAGAREVLFQAGQRAAAMAPGRPVRTEWRTGQPAEEIAHFAWEEACDLLVIGHVGRGRIAGIMLGSVAFKLLSLSPCPVTVVGSPPPR